MPQIHKEILGKDASRKHESNVPVMLSLILSLLMVILALLTISLR